MNKFDFLIISKEADTIGKMKAFVQYNKVMKNNLIEFCQDIANYNNPEKAIQDAIKKHNDTIKDLKESLSFQFANRSFNLTGKLLGKIKKSIDINFDNPSILHSKYFNGKLSKWINETSKIEDETTSELYQKLWEDAIKTGETDVNSLAKKILNAGLAGSTNRATMMAQTTSIYGYNAGAEIQYQETGIDKEEWSSALDDATCPICQSLDGKITEIKNKFIDKGDSIGDWTSKLDIYHPGLHPNCRCCILPVL